MALPEGITLVGYVGDTATEIMMRRVARWMGEHGLQLALAKTEFVILSGRQIKTIEPIRIGDQVFETKPSAVYLGGNDRHGTDVR